LKVEISGLYAITQEAQDTVELLHKVRLALQGGVRLLQYRNNLGSAALRLQQAMALRTLTHEFNVPLVINDDVQLASVVAADGVHLGFEDGSIAAARQVLGREKLIGVSCYNRLELAQEAEAQGADYVAFGAFFASTVAGRWAYLHYSFSNFIIQLVNNMLKLRQKSGILTILLPFLY